MKLKSQNDSLLKEFSLGSPNDIFVHTISHISCGVLMAVYEKRTRFLEILTKYNLLSVIHIVKLRKQIVTMIVLKVFILWPLKYI